MIESCRRCGKLFNSGYERGGHEARCGNIGVELDPAVDRCRKCGVEVARGNGRYHEAFCRGDKEKNTTIGLCSRFDMDNVIKASRI